MGGGLCMTRGFWFVVGCWCCFGFVRWLLLLVFWLGVIFWVFG